MKANETLIAALANTATPLEALAVFLTLQQLQARLPLSERTLRAEIKRRHFPYIKLPGSRRLLFDWDTVRNALLRHQKGGAQ